MLQCLTIPHTLLLEEFKQNAKIGGFFALTCVGICIEKLIR